jgi:hypothetical protein
MKNKQQIKIIFQNSGDTPPDQYFTTYFRDENLVNNPLYIDVRGIMRENCWNWLDDVHLSFSELSSRFLRYTTFWWSTPMSRLYVGPWGQEYLLKPLLFAKALCEWDKIHPNTDKIYIIGADPILSVYLKEFDNNLVIKGVNKGFKSTYIIKLIFKQTILSLLRMLNVAWWVLINHLFANKKENPVSEIMVLYESVNIENPSGGKTFFYKNIFKKINKNISYMNTSLLKGKNRYFSHSTSVDNNYLLLDYINIFDYLKAIALNVSIIIITFIIALLKTPCMVGSARSKMFFVNYLFNELGRTPLLNSLLCFFAMKRIVIRNTDQLVIFPYEEKEKERMILKACNKYGVKLIGYIPHPQSRPALILRDINEPIPPKPSFYALCGYKYVEYLTHWGKKDPDKLKIWGSSKAGKGELLKKSFSRSNLTVLVLLSHPNELKIFHSWLRAEEHLKISINYLIRVYKPGYHSFIKTLKKLTNEFDFVKTSNGNLIEDLNECDLTIFSCTSAGIEAINLGYISLYVDLNEFFEMNPCFDDLSAMLPSYSPAELTNTLDKICSMNNQSIKELYNKQFFLSNEIFSPIRTDTIIEDLNIEKN